MVGDTVRDAFQGFRCGDIIESRKGDRGTIIGLVLKSALIKWDEFELDSFADLDTLKMVKKNDSRALC
jgi:hypothetical protein